MQRSPVHFYTLPPGASLPGDAACAALVRPTPENKGMNVPYNATRGAQALAGDFFGGSDPRANTQIATRVTGNYVGTTDEILQWAACKWGIEEDVVRAQAVVESTWHQNAKGNWTPDATYCAPGHDLGVDGVPGYCPANWGMTQIGYRWFSSAWPGMATSTAFNLDTAYAVWRACYEGYEWWLYYVPLAGLYDAGDLWGCVGRWNTSRWHTAQSETYIQMVQSRLAARTWEQPSFQEP